MTLIAPTLQAFFIDRLARQLQASPRTIASYRDTLRLLLGYAHDTTGKQPSTLDWDDLDEPLIARFLDHLETDRHNSPRTRTCDSRRSDRCSSTARCVIPSTPP
jgi:hypothetical protein